MKKVGIMSMQRIANYGSFLQAYALKQLMEEVGCNVEFVDYHVGAPVIAENADSKNKVVRKIEKGIRPRVVNFKNLVMSVARFFCYFRQIRLIALDRND